MIPVLDWTEVRNDRPAFTAKLGQAVRETGFFLLSNADVPADLRSDVLRLADQFFDQPRAEKAKLSILDTPHFRGWGKPGDESLDETRPEVDTKETFNIGYDLAPDDPRVLANEPFRGVNRWPEIAGFSATMLAYYDACQAQASALLSIMADDLGLHVDHFSDLFTEPLSAMRLLHYPPATGAENEIGAGAHTDYGAITLLMTDGEPGLQVRPRGGDWIDVPHVPGAYVVNIGDCLMRWTNDIYVSTPHRVLPPKRQRRSVAFFCEANPDALVAALPGTGPAKYPPIRAADYLASRLAATYAPKDTE
ncbi:2-oxoglutarate and iron-dependent oxygenase domain-containing protein [uncultured Tateyamaria sp.]|uniref:isopenicillin N synthase family dioxygenase n=1 Tax=uncultured Tateyamaria sp. TaxID=455651 RepID=UPI002612C505|nr:2-oxoglutarate and iron-dependent oxygenase domain-containing protein [uncultured Tateyamaria sp.]